MNTRQTWATTLAVVLALGLFGCGGDDSTTPTPVPTPTPPTQAAVTFNVDPSQVVANHAGNDWYRFKVNLAFSESAGIGYTVNTIRTRISVTSTGQVALNYVDTVNTYVAPNGREVLQFTSALYRAAGGGRIGVTVDFTANITDDRGNALTATNQMTATHRRGPEGEIPD